MYGDLHDYNTSDYLRRASKKELTLSLEASFHCSPEGCFQLNGKTVYVEGESNEAHGSVVEKGIKFSIP